MREGQVGAALIGCGAISKAHLSAMKEAGLRIAAVCDAEGARAEQAKRDFGDAATRVVTDAAEVFADAAIDLVGIATPPFLHRDQTLCALQAGKHVYCEKPVAATLGEFEALFAAEKSSGRRAFFTPGRFRGGEVPLVRQYIQEGAVGEIYRVDARHFRPRGRPGVDNKSAAWFADSRKAIAGILGDMGLYLMDKAMFLTGYPPITAVSATMFKLFPHDLPAGTPFDVEEHALLHARTAGRLTFTFEFASISYYDSWSTNSLFLLGTKAGVQWATGRQEKAQLLTDKGPGRYVMHALEWKDPRKPDTAAYQQIAELVRNPAAPVEAATSLEEVYALHKIMALAYRSARDRRETTPADLDPVAPIFLAP